MMTDTVISPKEISEALLSATERRPSVIRSSADSVDASALDTLWQVFFLPTDDIENPGSVTAFCPFTGIAAAGRSVDEAAANWTRRAYRLLNTTESQVNLHIPKFLLHKRKVQYGEVTGANGVCVPVYVIDYKGVEASIIACPATRDFGVLDMSSEQVNESIQNDKNLAVNSADWDLDDSRISLSESVDESIMPGFTLDWVVAATPLTRLFCRSPTSSGDSIINFNNGMNSVTC